MFAAITADSIDHSINKTAVRTDVLATCGAGSPTKFQSRAGAAWTTTRLPRGSPRSALLRNVYYSQSAFPSAADAPTAGKGYDLEPIRDAPASANRLLGLVHLTSAGYWLKFDCSA